MANIFEQTNNLVLSYTSRHSFRLDKLESDIRSRGLPMRIAPGYTVRNYINDLEDEGLLKHHIRNGKTIYTNTRHKIFVNPLLYLPPLPEF